MSNDDLQRLALKALVARDGSVEISEDELLDAERIVCRMRVSPDALTLEVVANAGIVSIRAGHDGLTDD